MPLIHSKTPKAFKKNVEEMMHHGHPQKQALAAAYHEQRSAEHKAKGGCIGEACKGCSDPGCYAEGGSVLSWTKREDHEKGINKSVMHHSPGTSNAGLHIRAGRQVPEFKEDGEEAAKIRHHKVLDEMKSMKKPHGEFAEGGEVHEDAEQDKALIDSELHEMMGQELMAAIDNKDKKRIMESIEAIVLSCLSKGE